MRQIEVTVPGESVCAGTAAAFWEKPEDLPAGKASYRVLLNGELAEETSACSSVFKDLAPDTDYAVSVYCREAEDGEAPDAGAAAEGREDSTRSASLFRGLFGKKKHPAEAGAQYSTGFHTPPRAEYLSIVNFGAVGDGREKDTEAIQRAVNACRPWQVLHIPAGRWISGAVFLKSDLTLCLDEGAVLEGSPDPADYPVQEEAGGKHYAGLLNACPGAGERFSEIRIVGSGTIEGNGAALGLAELRQRAGMRGSILSIRDTDGFFLGGVTLREAPGWCIRLAGCTRTTILAVRIENLHRADGRLIGVPNNEGIDVSCCRDLRILRSRIESGDDGIAVRTGSTVVKPADITDAANTEATENIRISDCTFADGFGVTCGSGKAGTIRDVRVARCTYTDAFSIVSIKGCRGRGNKMEDITAEDCSLVNRNPAYRDCKWFRGAVNVDLFYGTADEERNLTAWQRPGADTPEVRHLTFRNLSIQTEGGRAIFLCGLPERHLTGIHLENIRAESRQGMAVENTDDLSIRALQLTVAGESEE